MVVSKTNPFAVFALVLLAVVAVSGCSTTKYVPQGERLLSKVDIKNPARDVTRQDLKLYLRQQENLRILGFWKFIWEFITCRGVIRKRGLINGYVATGKLL